MVTLERVHRVRGKIIEVQFVTVFSSYSPVEIMDAIRDDAEMLHVPRVMLSMDAIYGNMNETGRMKVAQQHKYTAPKTRMEYWIAFD